MQRHGQAGLDESPDTEVTETGLKTQARLRLSNKAAELEFVLKAQNQSQIGPDKETVSMSPAMDLRDRAVPHNTIMQSGTLSISGC